MKAIVVVAVVIGLGFIAFRYLPPLSSATINYSDEVAAVFPGSGAETEVEPLAPEPRRAVHIPTPSAVKNVYMTACIAATKNLRDRFLASIAGTEVNSIIIDIKDYTGTLAHAGTAVPSPIGKGCRIADLQDFLFQLEDLGIYRIARVTVFQDPLYASIRPELAVQSKSRPGQPWKDRKGLAFIDPNFPEYWEYIIDISKEAHEMGFDEINFDYIRFPSDGDMKDAMYAMSATTTRTEVMKRFFSHLHLAMSEAGIVTSADIFGQATVNYDDLGIGQVLEDVLPYFDYVAPMVYPSHFIKTFGGFDNPAAHPYEVLKITMTKAVERAIAASSSPEKIRPWLQAFDLGATYTPDMVRKQMQATYDSGLTSWMLWDPANTYDRGFFLSATSSSASSI